VNEAGPLPVAFFSNILQIGFAFAIGITFAIIICAPVSGDHFNPAITICFAIWQGFHGRRCHTTSSHKSLVHFVAGMVLMSGFWPEISAFKAANIAKEGTAVFNGGPASILCVFPNPNQTNHGFLFFQEFFVDSFIGIVYLYVPPL
jgi:glycerol uptake facilitator-like aquaporin